jgi:putative addiction module component (TIGR02574 family)
MPTRKQILSDAMTLSPEERDQLADELWRSVDRTNGDDIDAAWAKEIERRIDELDSGNVKTIPGEQVMEEVRQMLRRKRSKR